MEKFFTKLILSILATLLISSINGQKKDNLEEKKTKLNETEVMDWTWESLMRMYKKNFPKAEPSGKFYEAAFDIIRAVAQAHAAGMNNPDRGVDIETLRKYLRLATDSRSTTFARSTLGKTLYAFFKVYLENGTDNKGLKEHEVELASANFLDLLKKDIGETAFDELVAKAGGATLMFVIDTTGSMLDDIKATKGIAKVIITQSREGEVDYILSPFNDPGVGPVTYKTSKEGNEFVQAIDNIVPRGGGDCKEMAVSGMMEALQAGPRYGSPMFVITDASAKDDSIENVTTVKVIAQSMGITVNFFTKLRGCDQLGVQTYQDIAEFTTGQVFPLKSDKELKQLTGFVADSLQDSQVISMTRKMTGRRPRRLRRGKKEQLLTEYPITVDELISELEVAVTSDKYSKNKIILRDPYGKKVKAYISLTRSSVFRIKNPETGQWTLAVEGKIGRHDYVARVKSNKVVEFGYFFVFAKGKTSTPIDYPISGENATIYVTVGGIKYLNPSSLYLDVLETTGKVLLKGIKLHPKGKSGVHFEASFEPPGKKPFKLALKGNTKSGRSFSRLSKHEIKSESALLRILYGRREFTVTPGIPTFVLLGLHNNYKNDEHFVISASSDDGKTQVSVNKLFVKRKRMNFVVVHFRPSTGLVTGQTAIVRVTAKGELSKIQITTFVRLLVTPKYLRGTSGRVRTRNRSRNGF